MIKEYKKYLSLIISVMLCVMSSVPVSAVPGDVSSIISPNIIVIGDYAFELKDPSYNLNNFLTAARSVYYDSNGNQMYYNAGSSWYDLVANYGRGLIKAFTGVFNGSGKYKYYNMKVGDFNSKVVTATTVTFAWTTVPNATSVKIQQSPNGTGVWTDSNTIGGGLLSSASAGTVLGLASGGAYDFRLVVTGGEHAGNSNIVTVIPSAPISSAAEAVSSATYDALTGNLVLTGSNFNTYAAIDVTKLTIKGQGGVSAQVTLTSATSNPIPSSTTSATVTIAGTDKTAVDQILYKNGTTAPDSTTYALTAATGWQSGVTIATTGITVSNAAE